MTATKKPKKPAPTTTEHYRRDVPMPCGHVVVLTLSSPVSTTMATLAAVPLATIKEMARRDAEKRFDQAVKAGVACPECPKRPVER